MPIVLAMLTCSATSEIQTSGQGPGPSQTFPSRWIMIQDHPRPWIEPAGQRMEQALERDAREVVWVRQRTIAGADSTPWLEVVNDDATTWLPEALLAPMPQPVSADQIQKIGAEIVDRFHGIPADFAPPDLVSIGKGYEPERTYCLRKEAAEAFKLMHEAALLNGIDLKVVSAYRGYSTQRRIYLDKLDRSGWNQTTVAKPGHSEHQLGTTLDLTDGKTNRALEVAFGERSAGRWLLDHAPDFGFAISYTPANASRTGYSSEPWHYRYWGMGKARARHRNALNLGAN